MFRNPDFLRSERFSLAKTAIENQELAACCAALFRYPEVNMERLPFFGRPASVSISMKRTPSRT
jgi:hypothetical protein